MSNVTTRVWKKHIIRLSPPLRTKNWMQKEQSRWTDFRFEGGIQK